MLKYFIVDLSTSRPVLSGATQTLLSLCYCAGKPCFHTLISCLPLPLCLTLTVWGQQLRHYLSHLAMVMDKFSGLAIIVTLLTLFYGFISVWWVINIYWKNISFVFRKISVLEEKIGGISNNAIGVSLLVFSVIKVISGVVLLIGIKIRNRILFYPWIFLNCFVLCVSLVSVSESFI